MHVFLHKISSCLNSIFGIRSRQDLINCMNRGVVAVFLGFLVDMLPVTVFLPSNTCPAPLAKPGKKLPVISFSQDKSSGTSIQMITELGKKCLCPAPQFCNCRCLHISFSFDFSHWTRGSLHSHGITLSTFYPWFWLKLPVLFWPPYLKVNFFPPPSPPILLFFLVLQGL